LTEFVIDASMALAWFFRDEFSERARMISALADEQSVVVPAHWFAEIANGILMGERRGRSKAEDVAHFVRRLGLLRLEVDTSDRTLVVGRILPLARTHGLTIYDAFYLEIAERRGLPLASFDKKLNTAAHSNGVRLVEEHA
jgi:predicted nucleic acid-binding protein